MEPLLRSLALDLDRIVSTLCHLVVVVVVDVFVRVHCQIDEVVGDIGKARVAEAASLMPGASGLARRVGKCFLGLGRRVGRCFLPFPSSSMRA